MSMKVPIKTVIYLKFGSRVRIPVNPEELEISYPGSNKTYEVLNQGEIAVPKKPGLCEVTWEGYIPRYEEPFSSGGVTPGGFCKAMLKAQKNKTVGRLIITRSGMFDTNIRCIINEFEVTDKGGEPNDIYYKIKLLEYRSYTPKTITITQPAQTQADTQTVEATTTEERPVETPVLRVGATVIANGKYWNDSYGAKPFGTANNLQTTVTRIVSGNPYPIHIGHYGWLQESQLQIVG